MHSFFTVIPVVAVGAILFTMTSLTPGPGTSACTCAEARTNSVERIIEDASLPHEGRPAGVPDTFDWVLGPRQGYGNAPPQGWTAFIAWGQVYADAAGNPAQNTRVELRDIEAYYLSASTGRWNLLQFSRLVEGGAYVEDFAGDASRPADARPEAGGTLSVTAGAGYNFHFWPAGGRVTLAAADDMAGIFTTVQARLILDDSAGPDDRSQARYLLSVGADYWRSLDAQWAADWSANGDVAIGRFRYVTAVWQSYSMTTLSADELAANPPPLR
jgi:hypothetical protein